MIRNRAAGLSGARATIKTLLMVILVLAPPALLPSRSRSSGKN